MKKHWIPAGFAVAALVAFVPAVFGTNLAGIYVIRPLRFAALFLGLALAAGSLESAKVLHIRAHLLDHRKTYLQAARIVALAVTAALVLAGYVFFVTLGTWTRWPATTDYYDRLASALASGHLYVKESPPSALVALPDPYNPDARKGISGLAAEVPGSIWDMSLYDGHMYLYWGPAPAVLLLPVKALLPFVFGEQFLTLAFLAGLFLFEALILIRLWQRFFASLPTWAVIAAILLVGFANPVPWLLFSPRIYECAIAAGQFFLMGGLFFALLALDHQPTSHWKLATAAVLWACAVGSRATLAVAVVYLALMVLAWLIWQHGWRAVFRQAAWLVAPLVLGAILLMWYNLARFGSALEFGFRYGITMLDQNKYSSVLFSTQYLVPNAYLYLFNPPSLSNQFPFLKPVWNGNYVAAFNARYHSIYNAERIVGLLFVAPFFLLGILPPLFAAASLRRTAPAPRGDATEAEDGFLRWFLIMLSGLSLVQLLVVFVVFYSTMRYFLDAAPVLALLSVLGFWLLYQQLEAHRIWRAISSILALMLMLFTIVMGVLTGFSSDVTRIRAADPALLTHLRLFFIALIRRLGW